MKRVTTIAATLAVGLSTTGCVDDPYNDPQEPAASTTATTTAASPAPSPAPGGPAAIPAAPSSPVEKGQEGPVEAAVRRFAQGYVNWNWDRMASSRRELAGMAVGALREELLSNAVQIDTEAARRPSGQANEGSVEGVLIRKGKPIYVITRERATFGEGSGQQGYFVYSARVEREGSQWKLTDWRSVSG